MKKLICILCIAVICMFCGCSADQPQQKAGLSLITARLDMCNASGDKYGCYRITMDNENYVGLSYIDFSDNKEKVIKGKISVPQATTANIFTADDAIYLHTINLSNDMPTSALMQLSAEGEVLSQLLLPENTTIGEQLVQDGQYIYTLINLYDIKRSNLVKISKADMTYEILNDFNISAQLLAVYENCLILQTGKSVISYNVHTGQQTILLESDIRWNGVKNKLYASNGSYSTIEVYDLQSGVQYQEKISSSGMLADFRLHNDCLIPGYLSLYAKTEITREDMLYILNTDTMAVDKTIKMADYTKMQPWAVCEDKIIVVAMNDTAYPFTYEYRLMEISDYIGGRDRYITLDMIN